MNINIAPHEKMIRGYFQLGKNVDDMNAERIFFGKIGDLADAFFMTALMNELESMVFILNPEDVLFFKTWLESSLIIEETED
jgi:hypothetical protein